VNNTVFKIENCPIWDKIKRHPENYNLGKNLSLERLIFMLFTDPIVFEEFFFLVAGNVHVRPATGSSFNANISMHKLGKVGMFCIEADSFKAHKESQNEFYGLTIPLGAPFAISDARFTRSYQPGMGHMLSPESSLDLTCQRQCHFLACVFYLSSLNQYLHKLLQTDAEGLEPLSPDVLPDLPGSRALLGSVMTTWAQLENRYHSLSEIELLELEDDLLASLVLFSNDQPEQKIRHDSSPFRLAEEYICANLKNPVKRDTLAELSGTSIRNLSRMFRHKYGMGPMAFLKRRRLEAAYLDLLSAERDSITVTRVAASYGFSHFGKFAIEYKAAFGESPSSSLAKKKRAYKSNV
jgi:AraC-like DNA-binding protein